MNNKFIIGMIVVLSLLLVAILIFVGVTLDADRDPIDKINHGLFGWNEDNESEVSHEAHEVFPEDENSSGESSEDSSSKNPFGGAVINHNSNSSASSNSSSSSSSSSGGSIWNPPSGSGSSGNSSSGSSESKPGKEMTYEEYIALDGTAQKEYMESFSDVAAFFDWLNAAKEKYEKENPSIEIGGDETIDLGEIIGGNS